MSVGAIIALASAGGVSLILAVVMVILVSFAKGRSARADSATDQMVRYSETLAVRDQQLDQARLAIERGDMNRKALEDALANARSLTVALEEQAKRDSAHIRELIEFAGKDASADDVLRLLQASHADLGRNLARVRAQLATPGEAVSGTAAAGGEDHHGVPGAGVHQTA